MLALGTELGKERQCVSPLRMSLTASADTAERLCFIDALIEVHNSCELFSDDLEQNSCREGWFIFVTHAAWLVFVARERVHRYFLLVPPSRSVVFPMVRAFVFVVATMVLRLRFGRDVFYSIMLDLFFFAKSRNCVN